MSHYWIVIAVGRVCVRCQLVQENGFFMDKTPCSADRSPDRPRSRRRVIDARPPSPPDPLRPEERAP